MLSSNHPLFRLSDALGGRPAHSVLAEIAAGLARAESLAIASHVNLDGDALGATAALSLALRRLGKEARTFSREAPPEVFGTLLPPGLIEVVSDEGEPRAADAYVLLDTSDPERAGASRRVFERPGGGKGPPRICLDHHVPGPSARFDLALVVPEAPSTSNLVLALIDELGVPLDPELARFVWIGIATDTGWFRFSNTDAWALEDAARLVGFGVDTEAIYQRIYADLTVARARVLGYVLSGLRSEFGGRFAWSVLPRARYVEEGLRVPDLDGIVDYLKWVRGAEVVAFVVELEGGLHKVSLRATGGIDVGPVAREFGGGGHERAAGYRYRGTPEEVVAALAGRLAPLFAGEARASEGRAPA